MRRLRGLVAGVGLVLAFHTWRLGMGTHENAG
jgi:hypothetical protein